jgi:hypothetical protein
MFWGGTWVVVAISIAGIKVTTRDGGRGRRSR